MNEDIWLLLDDRPGNSNQVLGIAEHLGHPYHVIRVEYNAFARLPNAIRGSHLWGIKQTTREHIKAPWPRVVISAGRKTAPLALYIKKQSRGYTKVVHIMSPDMPFKLFDLLILPRHDVELKHIPLNPFIHVTEGAPNWVTTEVLDEAKKEWKKEFKKLPEPYISVFIGGATKHSSFGQKEAETLVANLKSMQKELQASLLISTSRRTDEAVLDYLKQSLTTNSYIHDFSSSALANPYRGMLALADHIVVTGDSISMCSEACTTGKPTYIYAPDNYLSKKHQIFVNQLFKSKRAHPLSAHADNTEYTPLDDASHVAEKIKELFLTT